MSKHTSSPNIVVIKTDQQRTDTIAAQGNDHMITPNLDRLSNESVNFTNAFCCGATCISSRAAFYTGLYPHNSECYSFDKWSHHRSWLHEIRDAGYQTAAIGKVHHNPKDAMMAYDERVYVENFPEMKGGHDDYANYLKAEGQENYCKVLTQDGKWWEKCASNVFPLEEKYHPDNYVGRMAKRWIDDYEGDSPFYLHIGFQGPHDPFAPSSRFLEMYEDREIPSHHIDEKGLDYRPTYYRKRKAKGGWESREREAREGHNRWIKPPAHGASGLDLSDKTEEDIRRMRRHYYAQMTQIDEQIGEILASLEEKGLLENTIILFTSDHGENLGDHGLAYKWVMTEQVVNIPMLVRLAGAQRGGTMDNNLFTHMDVGPTLLDALGLDIPQALDGQSNWQRLVNGDSSEAPERVYCEDNHLTMVRSMNRKLIMYTGEDDEEYFNLKVDPWEENNLVNEPAYQEELQQMKMEACEWLMASRYQYTRHN
mgnify:CR=1 FL=1